ncbi:MAG: DUF92 domain-containing protein [Gemmatimonadales bacterium]
MSAAVAVLAWAGRALTTRGAVLAAAIGALVLWGGGWAGGAALLAFFLSSSALSRLCPDPAAVKGEAKGQRRDAGQVAANGGAAALAALLALHDGRLALWAITASLAAAAADTWATAIGGTSPTPPRHLISGRTVAAGTSGAITGRGTLAAVAGAAFVAWAAGMASGDAALIPLATGIGFVGMGIDSLAGAVLQGRFHCPVCDLPTERAVHRCGTHAVPTGGLPWLTNDGVNALATGAAAVLGACCWLWLARFS